MKLRLLLVVLCSLAIALASASLAFAQGPTQSAYSGPGASQISQVGTTADSQATLPFTGMDLGLIAVVAVVLVGTGVVLRRVTKGSTD